MKKTVLGLVVVLAALGLIASPAMAAPDSPRVARVLSTADQVFLASLARRAPVSAAKHPAIVGKSSCTASATCADGSTISCSGNSSCSSADRNCPESGHVTCDGATTRCPDCINCGILGQQCSWGCNPCSYEFSCDESTGEWDCGCIMKGCGQ